MKLGTDRLQLMLKGTRTSMSFVADSRRLAREHPYPDQGQPEYSVMADILSRAVLFSNWEVVGCGALIRAGSVVRIVEMGLMPAFRSDEIARRLTWRMLADATFELIDTPEIEDAWGNVLDISGFVARRRANRDEDKAARPMSIGRIEIPALSGLQVAAARAKAERAIPRPPKATVL